MRVKHLLKSAAHQHKDPHVRLEHVRTLDPEDEPAAEMLAALAREDEEESVRVAAIERLRDLAVLRELLDANGDEAAREAAERRFAVLLEGDGISDVAVRALLDTHAVRLAPLVATHSPVAAQRELALDALEDETALVGVVQSSRLHDARLAAATRLTRHDTMRTALAACRSRDKVVAKHLQQRLDAEAAAEAARIATRHAVTTTLEAMRTLGTSVWSPQHAGRAQALRERWAAFEASDTTASGDEFAAAEARVRALLDEHAASAARASGETPGSAAAPEHAPSPDIGRAIGDGDATASAVARPEAPSLDGARPAPAPSATASGTPAPDAAGRALAERLRDVGIDGLLAAGDGAADEAAASSVSAGALRAHTQAVAVLFDPPFDHQRARPAAIRQRLRRVEALLDTNTLLPGLELTVHRYVQELDTHRAVLADRLGKSEQESADRVKATQRQFAALGGIIGEGKWAPANSLLKRLQRKLAAMEPAERAGLDDKLARVEQQLAEMGDWQDFAARPKLEALCVEMEALPGRELAPEKLAKEVRDLQSQWKGLGPSRAANELWPRFKTAGDAAYEPCKAWFAAKGEERRAKVDARRTICEALEADVTLLGSALVVDAPAPASPAAGDVPTDGASGEATRDEAAPGGTGPGDDAPASKESDARGDDTTAPEAVSAASTETLPAADTSAGSDARVTAAPAHGSATAPDWKAVQRRVGDAKREWSRNRITDRKPDRSLEGRFSAALKPYERALAAHYKGNEAEKRALIEKAAALASGEITQHVANQAKSLLSAWKLVGIVPRRADQALWETFNGHLGTIFRHQQTLVREKRRAGFEHVDRARAIARELRAIAKGDSVDETAVQTLADEFHALAEFPERDRRGLERDFRAALDATARVQETAGKRRRQAEADERRRLVSLCERLEAALESPDQLPDGGADTLREDVLHAWEASETRVVREMAVRLEGRRDAALAHLAAGSGHDLAANEERRRDLLIRMEVAADIETPPEDKSRRMRYQLENLQVGMTSAGVADRRATLAALEEDWLAAPPASRTVHDALQSRYLRALGR